MKVVGVCSVKGGTGKTLMAINLAHFLSKRGKTGLIDCDIDSSNFAEFVRIDRQVEVDEETKLFRPVDWDGVKVWSTSLAMERWRPISMTGDKYAQILNDVVHFSEWGDLDYMVLDLPAGAMDTWRAAIYIFAEEFVGDVVVIQPAFEDNARRVLRLHEVNEVPVIGLIENMSYFVCPHHKKPKVYKIFGEGIGEKLASEYGVEFLGSIPLIGDLQQRIENGNPILEEYSEVFEKACDIIEKIPPEKVGIIRRVGEKLKGVTKQFVDRILASLVTTAYREVELPPGVYDESSTVDLVILDDTRTKVITRWHLGLRENKLRFIKNPKKVDYEIHTTFRTLARVLMGKKKTRFGTVIPYDVYDAYNNMDIEVYGTGATPRALRLMRKVLFNPEVLEVVRKKHPILEKFI